MIPAPLASYPQSSQYHYIEDIIAASIEVTSLSNNHHHDK